MTARAVAVLIAGLLSCAPMAPASAGVYCSEPRTPTFYERKPTKPTAPYCVNEYARTHSCSEVEISRYNREIDVYNAQLESYMRRARSYISELNDFLKKAREYAQCESDNL